MHGVGRVRLGHRLVGDRDLVRVVAAAADEPLLGLERGDARLGVHEGDAAVFTSAITSGPMPSPARRRSFFALGMSTVREFVGVRMQC